MEGPLLVFVIVLLGVLAVHTLTKVLTGIKEIKVVELPEPCTRHTWITDDLDNKMYCDTCDYVAGSDMNA